MRSASGHVLVVGSWFLVDMGRAWAPLSVRILTHGIHSCVRKLLEA